MKRLANVVYLDKTLTKKIIKRSPTLLNCKLPK